MAVIAGWIDQGGEPPAAHEDISSPQIAMEQGRRRIRGQQLAQAPGQTIDPLAPRPVEEAGGGDQPLLAPELRPVAGLAIVKRDRAECIIDRPAEAFAFMVVQLAQLRADVRPGMGVEESVIFDMGDQQHVIMFGLDRRHGHARGGKRTKHGRLGRQGGPAFRHERVSIVAGNQEHLAQIAPGEPLQPALR